MNEKKQNPFAPGHLRLRHYVFTDLGHFWKVEVMLHDGDVVGKNRKFVFTVLSRI